MIEVSAAEIASTWRQLEHRYGCGGLATSWTWVETWLRHYGDLVPHRFVVAERNGPCGIALVTSGVGKRRGPFNVRTLHLGTAGEPDAETVRIQYNRLLAEPSAREDMASALLRLLATSGGPWDELRLDGFEPGEALPLLAASGRFATDRRLTYVTDLSTIRSSGRRVLEGLDPHAAKKLRRSIRLIEQSHGSLAVEWATTAGAAREIFDEMVSLHEARWRADGLPGVFASKRFTGFNRDLIESLFPPETYCSPAFGRETPRSGAITALSSATGCLDTSGASPASRIPVRLLGW